VIATKPVLASATWDGRKLVMADLTGYRAALKQLELGAGEQVTIRVERPEDARKYHQLKFLWGYVYRPVATFPNCGHTMLELHAFAKSMFLPDGKLSTLDLSYEEMDEFCRHTERWLRESMPEAFEAGDAARLGQAS
jgi:hypothetical protein